MNELGSKLRLAYYEASDGPRIMVFGPLHAQFGELQELFAQLSRTVDMSCNLHEFPPVAAFGGIEVRLLNMGPMFSHSGNGGQGIKRVVNDGPPVFEWRRTQEGWDYLAELITPIVNENIAGHQYLTRFPGEDAIVVVSKGEYTDEVLN